MAKSLEKSGLTKLSLPAGWSSWTLGERYLIIAAPGALCTIDTEVRCFRAGGNVTSGPAIGKRGTAGYSGRGWAVRLHADAVAWLRKMADTSLPPELVPDAIALHQQRRPRIGGTTPQGARRR